MRGLSNRGDEKKVTRVNPHERFIISLAMIGLAVAFLSFCPEAIAGEAPKIASYDSYIAKLAEAAKKEGRFVLYSSHTEEPGVLTIGQLFGKQYPFIKVEEVMEASNTRLLERMRLEIKAGRSPDVAAIGGGAQVLLKEEGYLTEYETPIESLGLFRDEYKPTHRYWTPYAFRTLHNVYNRNLVKTDELTKDHSAWLNPKWKRRVGIDIGGTFWQWWTTLEKRYGVEQAEAFMRKFADNEPVPFFSNSQIRNLVAAGELAFGNYIYLDNILVMQKQGAPLEIWNPDPLPLTLSNLSVLKTAPNPNAAKLFIEFLLSEPIQIERAKRTVVVPARKDVENPHPQYFKGNFVSLGADESYAAEKRQRQIYEKYFRVAPQKRK